jgi:hypothetical protein
MSEPRRPATPLDSVSIKEAISNAMAEAISAESSLNMYPDILPEGQQGQYTSEIDRNAQHATEHIQAAVAWLDYIWRQTEGRRNLT